MEKQNLRNLWKIAKLDPTPMLGDATKLGTLDFMAEYLENYRKLDRNLISEKGFFSPLWNEQYEDDPTDVLAEFQEDCFDYLWKNKERYGRLYALLSIDYEPLTNYDKHSYIVENDDGEDLITDNIGARHTEDDIAQRQDTNQYGQKQLSDLYGAISESDVHGAKSTTSINEVAGFNSIEFNNSERTQTSDPTYTDIHTEQSKTDIHTDAQHTDTLTQGAHLDKHDERATSDTHRTEYGKEHYFDEHTTGNIGVTTSQQMAESEIDLWTKFKFYDIIFNDITKDLCTYYDPGYDCF